MARSSQASLTDIRDAIDRIEEIVAPLDRDSFAADTVRRLAVERLIEIVSEASRNVADDAKNRHPHIRWRNIADMGNVLRHAYASVDVIVIWTVATQHLKPLREAVVAELERYGA